VCVCVCVCACVRVCVCQRAPVCAPSCIEAHVPYDCFASGVTWTSRTTSAPWAARTYHTSVIDAAGAIYVIGGYGGEGTDYQDVWASTDGGARPDSGRGWSGDGTTGFTLTHANTHARDMHIYRYVYTQTGVRACVCGCVRACVRACVYVCTCIYIDLNMVACGYEWIALVLARRPAVILRFHAPQA
jgi:hypothetical protein